MKISENGDEVFQYVSKTCAYEKRVTKKIIAAADLGGLSLADTRGMVSHFYGQQLVILP